MEKDIKIIIFDFDGTLVDSMQDFGTIAAQAMNRYFGCGVEWARKRYMETSGLPFSYQIEKIFPGDPKNQKAICDFNMGKQELYEKAPFYEDVWECLIRLKMKGYLIAISSNNEQSLLNKKLKNEQNSIFDMVLGFRPGFLKGKDHFRWLRHCLKVDFSQMIFIGDSLNDARLCSENKVRFIARTGTFSEKDFRQQGIAVKCISSLAELEKCFDLLDVNPLRAPLKTALTVIPAPDQVEGKLAGIQKAIEVPGFPLSRE